MTRMNGEAKVNMEYSPLNKLSSSEEEIEQYTLPAAPIHVGRSKRRKKRKEFDSLKAHAVNTSQATRLCMCGSCVTSIAILVLLVFICALSVVVYYLSNDVAKMQKLIDNMHITEESSSLKQVSLQKQSDELDTRLERFTLTLQSINTTVQQLDSNITAVSHKVHKPSAVSNSNKEVNAIQQKLAQFGSELTSIKGDVANLKQKELSFEDRMVELDASISALSHATGVTSATPSTTQSVVDLDALKLLRSQISSVNSTCTSQISWLRAALYNVSIADLGDQTLVNAEDNIQLAGLNHTLEVTMDRLNRLEESYTAADKSLVERVDELESYIRAFKGELQALLTDNIEDRLVNLTIASGMEDILTRVVDQKTSAVFNSINRHSEKLQSLQDQLAELNEIVKATTTTTLVSTTAGANSSTSDTPGPSLGTSSPTTIVKPNSEEILSTEAPPKETQSKETPSQVTPSQETPPKETPSQVTPSQETPSKVTQSQKTPPKETPSKEVPSNGTAKDVSHVDIQPDDLSDILGVTRP